MQIVSWNVNSVRQRLGHLLTYLNDVHPEVMCLQELKCVDEAFPRTEIEALGYNCAVHGQKGFNGVAILSTRPMDVEHRLPGDVTDDQSRYLEAVIPDERGAVRVGCLYLPNGNPAGTEKYAYKLAWMDRLIDHARRLLSYEEALVLTGDFNVIPQKEDAKEISQWLTDALYLPETRQRFRQLLNLGLTDALRAVSDEPGLYTFWDYQAGAFQRNNGIRIDHALLSAQAADRLTSVGIDRAMREGEKPSDHVPLRIKLN